VPHGPSVGGNSRDRGRGKIARSPGPGNPGPRACHSACHAPATRLPRACHAPATRLPRRRLHARGTARAPVVGMSSPLPGADERRATSRPDGAAATVLFPALRAAGRRVHDWRTAVGLVVSPGRASRWPAWRSSPGWPTAWSPAARRRSTRRCSDGWAPPRRALARGAPARGHLPRHDDRGAHARRGGGALPHPGTAARRRGPAALGHRGAILLNTR
jgi:hypothetical protein